MVLSDSVNEALQYLRKQKREVPLGEEHTETMTYEEPAFDEDKQAYEAVMQLSETYENRHYPSLL